MGKIPKNLLLLILLTCFIQPGFSQTKKDKKKDKQKEEVEMPPPPPMEELREARIDTTSSGKGFTQQDFFFNNFDTASPPADELTTGIRKFLETTGAINLGVQFAKAMEGDKDNLLPREFYDRLYKEMSEGEGKRYFENILIKIYRKYYTLEDIKILVEFYTSEVGKKTLAMMPNILAESQEAGAGFGRMLGMKIYNDLLSEGKIK